MPSRRLRRRRWSRRLAARSLGEDARQVPDRDGAGRWHARQGQDLDRAPLRTGTGPARALSRRYRRGCSRPPARGAGRHDPQQHGEHHWPPLARRRHQQMAPALRRRPGRCRARGALCRARAAGAGYVRACLLGALQGQQLHFPRRSDRAECGLQRAARLRPRADAAKTPRRAANCWCRPSRRRCIRATRWPGTCCR